jgi:GDPmannose 4,6-dehydratase
VADPSKTRSVLQWEPSVNFRELVEMMVDSDLARVEKQAS